MITTEWSRRAEARSGARLCTRSCTAIRTSRSSTARAIPRSWSRKPRGSGLAALAITDHDGFYGVVRFAEAARPLGLADGVRHGADARRHGSRPNGIADPAGEHLVVLAQGPVGYAAARPGDQRGAARGARRARRASLAQLADAARAPVLGHGPTAGNDHWFVLTGCRKGTVPAALDRDGPAAAAACARRAGRRVRARPGARRAVGPRRPARPAPQRRARADRDARRGRGGRDEQRALRHARAPPARAARSPRCAPAVRSTRSTAGCRPRRSRTCAARPSSCAGSRAGPARSNAPSRSRTRAPST